MAVNRVVLQHFSVNLEELLEKREPRLSTSSTDDENHPYGHMSDSSCELSEHGKNCVDNSCYECEPRKASYSARSSMDSGDANVIKSRVLDKDYNSMYGLSPPSESRLMQRRLKARSSLVERNQATIITSISG